jgi:hypothetical protein
LSSFSNTSLQNISREKREKKDGANEHDFNIGVVERIERNRHHIVASKRPTE